MKKEYKIVQENIKLENGDIKVKYNIYYFVNGEVEMKEFHSTDGISGETRQGYTENNNLNHK